MFAAVVAAMHLAFKALLIFFLVMVAKSIEPIVNFFILLWDGIKFVGKLLAWFAHFMLWFFTDLININMLFTDLIGGVVRITRIIIIGLTDVFFGIIRYLVNTLFGPLFGNIWGWVSAQDCELVDSTCVNYTDRCCRCETACILDDTTG